MIELGKSAREFASRFPKGHPERQALEGVAMLAESWARRNGTKTGESTRISQELAAVEKHAWSLVFFGKEIEVPAPPQELLDALTRAKEQGITALEPHFLPKVELKQNDQHPGWRIKPEDWYWQKIKEGKVERSATKLPGIWVLIDGSQKPEYDGGKQLYEDDPFASLLAKLREKGKIVVPSAYSHVPQTSRFAISSDDINKHVKAEIAQLLQVRKSQVRLPREIEFNVLGNLYHPEWGRTNTWEWFEDGFGGSGRLDGGYRGSGGLASVDCTLRGYRSGDVGFRPLVTFPSKS